MATYDDTISKFILMIGNQLLLVLFIIMVLTFGVDKIMPGTFPADNVRKMINAMQK